MSVDIRRVKDMNGLITYLAEKLSWRIDLDDFEDIEDIAYDFEAEDIGLKEEAFVKIQSLRQLPPLVDGQKWGIFCVEFDSKRFEVTALRKILSGLIPKRRNSADHAVWDQKDLLFICFWGSNNERTIGLAHFEDVGSGLPQIKMISCCPAVEDFTQIKVFEDRLKNLKWPANYVDHVKWQEDWSNAFTTGYKQTIQDSSTLTSQLAIEAKGIKDRILDILEVETSNGYVHLLYDKFKNTLIHDMTEIQFADMYAQTVVYGLFSARCMDNTQNDFSAAEAIECIPNTNPFLKSLMRECLGAQNNSKLSFDELEIGNIVDLLLHTKTDAIIKDFNRQTGGGREDPVIHFYEEFLAAYDKEQKIQRGVFYTPQPVVNFMVKAVDYILKNEFGYEDGLASEEKKTIKYVRQSQRKIDGYYRNVEDVKDVFAVQILDPATGTGTFLRQIILQIYKTFQEKHKGESKQVIANKWNEYVDNSLLPRINGFELMMAPYAVAHMKLAMVLKDTGYTFSSGQRLNVFLTNSLEVAGRSDAQLTLFDDPLAVESVEANAVKKNTGLNVIIGNPPYSSESSNRSEWIMNLMEDYKREPGSDQRLQERNYKAINDDYVKFVRMASAFLDSEGSGIIAYINNHAFIDNPTFRGMRWDLLQKCDAIYIMDLHGNIMRKEVAEDGSKDENVFDIQQGVSINFFIKKKKKSSGNCRLYHYDLFGTREKKYSYLNKEKFGAIEWERITPKRPQYFFIPRNEKVLNDYTEGFSIQDLMPTNTACIVTSRDAFVISTNKEELVERIRLFADLNISDDSIQETLFGGKKLGSWDLNKARRIVAQCNINDYIQEISYRPFDTRFIFYHSAVVDRGREEVMRHMIAGENTALIVSRQAITDNWSHVQITNNIADNRVQYSNKGLGVECPLYLYINDMRGSRVPNLSDQVIKNLESSIKSRFVSEETNRTDNVFTPLDVVNYVYAVLNSNKYRKKYIEFLRTDFPRIPYPQDKKYFFEMAYLGNELRKVNTSETDDYDCRFQYFGTSTAAVDKAVYKNNTIYLNKNKDCIKNVPEEIWNHYYGGYQPVQKWLKDRKNTTLGITEINHLLHIITALKVNIEIMDRIDSLIIV